MFIPDELRTLYQQGRILPFVGAGVSMSVHWRDQDVEKHGPSWTELVNQATQLLGIEDPSLIRVRGTDLQILEYFRLRERGAARLTNWLTRHLTPPDSALRDAPILAALAQLDRCGVFYTTNFDDFLERSLGLNGRACRVVALEAHMGLPLKTEVVKFHGDLNHPESMVLSESDYQRRLKFESPLDFRLRSDLLGRAVLFIGYSFRDPNVAYLFRLLEEQMHGSPVAPSGRRGYITVADPSDFEHRLFRDRNIEVIPITGGNVIDDVVKVLTELRRPR